MGRLNILYLLGHLSYPLKIGHLVHAVELLKYMQRDNNCDVIAFTAQENDDLARTYDNIVKNINGINLLGVFPMLGGLKLKLRKIMSLASIKPIGIVKWENKNVKELIKKSLFSKKYDLMHLNWFPATAQYLPICGSVPTVLTLPDAQSLVDIEAAAEAKNKFQKNLCLLASILYRKLEKHLLPIATKIQAVSCVDQRYLQGFVPAADIELIPTFIPKDAELFDTGSVAKTREPSVILPRPYGRGLLWFLEKVCPLLDKMVPDLRISIVSQRIPVEAENIIAKRANVSYIHWVEDFNTELARHHAVVLTEMSGTGLSTRVLIALALGCAVIGTAKSFRGMSFQDGQHCLIRGDPKSFAEAIVSVVKSRELATRLGQSGKKAAIEQYSYSKVMSDTYSLYLKAIRKFHKNSFQERDRSVYSCR